jgi:hypothetical protein
MARLGREKVIERQRDTNCSQKTSEVEKSVNSYLIVLRG